MPGSRKKETWGPNTGKKIGIWGLEKMSWEPRAEKKKIKYACQIKFKEQKVILEKIKIFLYFLLFFKLVKQNEKYKNWIFNALNLEMFNIYFHFF